MCQYITLTSKDNFIFPHIHLRLSFANVFFTTIQTFDDTVVKVLLQVLKFLLLKEKPKREKSGSTSLSFHLINFKRIIFSAYLFSSWDLLNGGQSSDRGHKTDVEKIRKGVKNLGGHIRNRVGVWIIASKKICLFYCEWYRKNETQRKVIYQNLAFSKVYLICIYKI